MELDRPRLAFVHIEKCGGTTLRGMLETQWAPDRICPERHDPLLAGLTDVDVPLYAMAGRLFGERLRHVGLAA